MQSEACICGLVYLAPEVREKPGYWHLTTCPKFRRASIFTHVPKELTVSQEKDSDYHTKKHDLGKARMDLLPWDALEEVAKVSTFGCTPKEDGGAGYAEESWKTVPNGYRRYRAAQHRHDAAIDRGQTCDVESGLLHEAHIAWNALSRLWFKLQEARAQKVKDTP